MKHLDKVHKVIFKIHHRGCWGSDIGLRFPKLRHSSIDCRYVGGRVSHIVLSSGDERYFDGLIKYFKMRGDVESVGVLSRTQSDLYLQSITKNDETHEQFSNIFFKNRCFPVESTKFVGKYEFWTLGALKRGNITGIYNHLKKRHSVEVVSLKNEDFKTDLTLKQREMLMYAYHFGYYNWPRKISVTSLCRLLKISKTVFLSHLRKAENVILKDYSSRL